MKPELKQRPGSKVRTVMLPSGRPIPILGQGTWGFGEDPAKHRDEIAAIRLGLDLGMTLIDTAEMYGDGAAEELIGEAIEGRREEVFLVSKVLPEHGSTHDTVEACERSLERLGTDYLDLYLLHWRGEVVLEETLEAFHGLKEMGKILDYGVSNFDGDDLVEALSLPYGATYGEEIVTDQVLYNLLHRGIEWDLLLACEKRNIPIMAYSPFEHSPSEQKRLLEHPALVAIANRHDATPAQMALAWLLQRDIITTPKASNPEHIRENCGALELKLTPAEFAELDDAFSPPNQKVPLEVI